MHSPLIDFIVEKMGADPSGKFDKDWRRINLTAALGPGTESAGGRWPTANTPLPKKFNSRIELSNHIIFTADSRSVGTTFR